MKDFLELIRDTQWLKVQLWLGWLLPVLVLFRRLFPKDFDSLLGKIGSLGHEYGVSSYTSLYPTTMKFIATGGVCALVTAFSIHLLGRRREGNGKELNEFHYRVGHLGVGLVNWYWLLLFYGLFAGAPVYWFSDRVFYLFSVLGLWVGPVLLIINILSLFAPGQKKSL